MILKYCMKENANIIREGFIIDQNRRTLVSSILEDYEQSVGKIEGNHLVVTARDNEGNHDKIEGPNLMITKQ